MGRNIHYVRRTGRSRRFFVLLNLDAVGNPLLLVGYWLRAGMVHAQFSWPVDSTNQLALDVRRPARPGDPYGIPGRHPGNRVFEGSHEPGSRHEDDMKFASERRQPRSVRPGEADDRAAFGYGDVGEGNGSCGRPRVCRKVPFQTGQKHSRVRFDEDGRRQLVEIGSGQKLATAFHYGCHESGPKLGGRRACVRSGIGFWSGSDLGRGWEPAQDSLTRAHATTFETRAHAASVPRECGTTGARREA